MLSTPHFVRCFILLSALVVFGAACSSSPDVQPSHFEEETISPGFLHEILAERQREVVDLKAFVKTIITTPRKDQSFRQVLLLGGKDRLRLDTLTPFNQPLSIFILRGDTTSLFDLKKNRMYTGLEVLSMMHQLLGTVIDFSEYIPVFSGAIPRLEHLEWQGAELDEEKARYVLTAKDPDRREFVRIRIDATTLLPVTLHKWVGKRPLYSVVWTEYERVGEHMFPHQVTVARAAQKDRVTLVFSNPIINKGIEDVIFSPKLPGLSSSDKPDDS